MFACEGLTKGMFSIVGFVFCGAGIRESAYGTRVCPAFFGLLHHDGVRQQDRDKIASQ